MSKKMRKAQRFIFLKGLDDGPTKTVTIRDVNKELYEQFSRLSSSFGSTGTIFSSLISSYGKEYHRLFLHGMRHRSHDFADEDYKVEVISDLDEFTVTKADLLAVGDDIKFFFKNIGKLTFDDTIDNKTLLKYVLKIRNCDVTTKGDISKLFLKSINQGKNVETYFDILSKETTNITIRNVSEAAYADFTANCQTNSVKAGDAVNDLLKRALPHLEISQIIAHNPNIRSHELITLTMHDLLEISNQDLLDLEGRELLLHRINHLTFLDDVTGENFKQLVIGIYNCNEIEFNDAIPTMLQYSRTKNYP